MPTPESTTENRSTKSSAGLRNVILGFAAAVIVMTIADVSVRHFNPNTEVSANGATSAEVALASKNAFTAGRASMREDVENAYNEGVDDEAEWCVGVVNSESVRAHEKGRDEGYEHGLKDGIDAGALRCEAEKVAKSKEGYQQGTLDALAQNLGDLSELGYDSVGATVVKDLEGNSILILDPSPSNDATISGAVIACLSPNNSVVNYTSFPYYYTVTFTAAQIQEAIDTRSFSIYYDDGTSDRIQLSDIIFANELCAEIASERLDNGRRQESNY